MKDFIMTMLLVMTTGICIGIVFIGWLWIDTFMERLDDDIFPDLFKSAEKMADTVNAIHKNKIHKR